MGDHLSSDQVWAGPIPNYYQNKVLGTTLKYLVSQLYEEDMMEGLNFKIFDTQTKVGLWS